MVGLENLFKKSKDFLLAYIVNEYWQKLTAANKDEEAIVRKAKSRLHRMYRASPKYKR
jgi:hypothetical protein